MSVLPDAERAFVAIGKLRDYCLDPAHPRGRHKARVFRASLGIGQADAAWLRTAILDAVRTAPAVAEGTDRHGTRWRADLVLTRGDRSATVHTWWLMASDGSPPRLVTCYVL